MFNEYTWLACGLVTATIVIDYNVKRGTWTWKSLPALFLTCCLGPIGLMCALTIATPWALNEMKKGFKLGKV